MSAVFASLIPTFLIIATGWFCRMTGLVDDRQWAGLERTTYMIFLPALIIDTLSRADLSGPVAGVGGALVAGILTVAAIMLSLPTDSFARMSDRWTELHFGLSGRNTLEHFVGFSVAGSLFGQRGIALIAVAIAAMVPLLNLLAFYVFIRFAGQPRQSPYEILTSFAKNPFIWSCAIGSIGLNLLFPPLPGAIVSLYLELMDGQPLRLAFSSRGGGSRHPPFGPAGNPLTWSPVSSSCLSCR